MGSSEERVAERLSAIRDAHPQVPVEQTTAMVASDIHDRIAANTDVLEARIRVENGDGETLYVGDGERWSLPCISVPDNARLGTEVQSLVARRIEAITGVEPVVGDIELVTITGYHCEERANDDDPVYRIVADYRATPASGSPDDGAEWRQLDE